jgi:glycosyltransferase involved in cell wall biosynthesis
MIVKNEERLLKRCLDSYLPVCDEIIIVDTGSTDRTKEIAAEYTDKIYDYEWSSDFAAARNFAFEKAGCEYIFSADADEVLDKENCEAFLELKEKLLPEIDIVQMIYVNDHEFNTVYNFKEEYRPKLFKRLRTFRWISPIHETVRLEPVVFDSDIKILHLPETNHSSRDFAAFINAVKKGVHLENYVVIMFCKELFISGSDEDFLNAAEVFENVLAKEDRNTECRNNIACVLARIYRLKNDYNNFFKICLKNMADSPCAEICMELGDYFHSLKDYDEAVLWYINAASETESIIDIHSSGDAPLYRLAECYTELADLARREKNYELYSIYTGNSDEYRAQAEAWRQENN